MLLYLQGDLLAQTIEKQLGVESHGKKEYNYERTGRMMLVGAIYAGPYMHHWYKGINKVANLLYPSQRWRSIFFKTGCDQIFGMLPCLTGYFALTGLLEGRSRDGVYQKVVANTHMAWGVGMLAWTPIQVINFAFVPPQHTVLFVGCFNAIWTAYLSVLNHSQQYKVPLDSNQDLDQQTHKVSTQGMRNSLELMYDTASYVNSTHTETKFGSFKLKSDQAALTEDSLEVERELALGEHREHIAFSDPKVR